MLVQARDIVRGDVVCLNGLTNVKVARAFFFNYNIRIMDEDGKVYDFLVWDTIEVIHKKGKTQP